MEFSPSNDPKKAPGAKPEVASASQAPNLDAHASQDGPIRVQAPVESAYQEARDRVIYGDEVDVVAARDTAYEWHGGQWSDLYSFASTDATVHSEEHRSGLESEIQHNIEWVGAQDEAFYSNKQEHLDELDNLLRTVRALPAKNPEQPEVPDLSEAFHPVGTYRWQATSSASAASPLYGHSYVYGVRDLPAEIGEDPSTVQALVKSNGGLSWINVLRADLKVDGSDGPGILDTREQPDGFFLAVSRNIHDGYDVKLITGPGKEPETFWNPTWDTAQESMNAMAADYKRIVLQVGGEAQIDRDLTALKAKTPREALDLVTFSLHTQGEGQIQRFRYTESQRDALIGLGIGTSLSNEEWKAIRTTKDDLEEAIDALNEKLPEGVSVFFDYDNFYASESSLYVKDEKRQPIPSLEMGPGRVSVTLDNNPPAVLVQNDKEETNYLQGDDEIAAVRHSLHWDHMDTFDNGWPVVIENPGYTFGEEE